MKHKIMLLFLCGLLICLLPSCTGKQANIRSQNQNSSLDEAATAAITSGASITQSVSKDEVWVKKMNMPVQGLVRAVVLNERIYILGDDKDNNSFLYEYDPISDEWTKKSSTISGEGSVAVSGAGGAAAVYNGKIYLFGGYDFISKDEWVRSKTIQEYDPDTDQWIVKGEMPDQNYSFDAVTKDEKIYLVGGEARNIMEFMPDSDQWQNKKGSFNCNAAALLNGIIYAGTGDGGWNSFDPENERISALKPMPSGNLHIVPVIVDDKIYIIGGGIMPEQGISDQVSQYDPSQDNWVTKTPAPYKFWGAGIAAYQGKIYLFGGALGGGLGGDDFLLFDSVYVYNPAIDQ